MEDLIELILELALEGGLEVTKKVLCQIVLVKDFDKNVRG